MTEGGGVGLGVGNGAGGRAGGRHAGGVDRICAAATGLDRKGRTATGNKGDDGEAARVRGWDRDLT